MQLTNQIFPTSGFSGYNNLLKNLLLDWKHLNKLAELLSFKYGNYESLKSSERHADTPVLVFSF